MHDDRKTKPIHPNQGTPVRTRLLLLVLAGALLLSGAYYWVKALKEKEEPQPLVSMGEKLPASPGAVKSGPAAVPGPSRALPAAPPASPAAGSARPLTAAPPASPAAGSARPLTAAPPASPAAGSARPLTAAPPASPAAGSARPLTAAPPAVVRMLPVPGAPPADTAGSVSPPAVPIFVPKSIPSTARQEAAVAARLHAGKQDPYAPVGDQLKPFPRPRAGADLAGLPASSKPPASRTGAGRSIVPPPPPGSGPALVPPPEPPSGADLSVAELPEPPARPSIADKMKLVGIVGDRAILAFSDRELVRENKWPKMVTLGTGEQFESVKVVGVSGDSVTVEEDGERSVKTIPPVK